MDSQRRVVIIGGGFGGLNAARSLRRAPVDVTLVDRRNYHLFQPLLYQVATGGLSPANISATLRSIFKRQKNTRVLLAEVCDFDLVQRKVILTDGELPYDWLIVASGSSHSYFGHDQWAELAPGLKTIENATEIRRRIFLAFEAAERETDAERIREWLTFVVVGGGPTGVELAGTLAEIAKDTLRNEFRSIDPSHARVVLVEGGSRVLQAYPPELSGKAQRQLEQLGVVVRTGSLVTDVGPDRVTVRSGERADLIPTRTVLWSAGVKASPLGARLAEAAKIETDRVGRVPVGPNLSVPGFPEVFVIGDLAHCPGEDGQPLAGVAPVAMQQGHYVAERIRGQANGGSVRPFTYHDRGTMATIGRRHAVAWIGGFQFAGYPAWLLWLFVHLMYIVGFQNRVLVLLQWAWNFVTWNRAARLITGPEPVLLATSERSPCDEAGSQLQERIHSGPEC